MKKMAILYMCFILLTTFVSCRRADQELTRPPETIAEPSDTVFLEASTGTEERPDYTLNQFDQSLIDYLWANGYYDSDFIISPAAFRASLCTAALGAEGNTRTELVSAAGFSSMDDLNAWYHHFQDAVQEQFCLTGISVWNDKDSLGEFTDFYQNQMKQYSAETYVCTEETITSEINHWVSGKTDNGISSIAKDVSGAASVLMSAVSITMPVGEQTGEFLYTEENGTKIIVLPMQGNLSFVCFTGNRIDKLDKLTAVEKETVHAVLPEFGIESVFDANDLLNFLLTRGIETALNGQTANFYPMCQDSGWFLQEIIQTARISVSTTAVTEDHGQPSAKEFNTEYPFSFIIFDHFGTSDQQALLYGQIMKAETS